MTLSCLFVCSFLRDLGGIRKYEGNYLVAKVFIKKWFVFKWESDEDFILVIQ